MRCVRVVGMTSPGPVLVSGSTARALFPARGAARTFPHVPNAPGAYQCAGPIPGSPPAAFRVAAPEIETDEKATSAANASTESNSLRFTNVPLRSLLRLQQRVCVTAGNAGLASQKPSRGRQLKRGYPLRQRR